MAITDVAITDEAITDVVMADAAITELVVLWTWRWTVCPRITGKQAIDTRVAWVWSSRPSPSRMQPLVDVGIADAVLRAQGAS
jgi:hypothetical protein